MGLRVASKPLPSRAPRVVIVQRVLPHYRVSFFDQLHVALAANGIDLDIVYGQHAPNSVPETVALHRPWGRPIKNRYGSLFGHYGVWQPVLNATRDADLVIVEHAARLVANYFLHAYRATGRLRLAYWGHGANFQLSNSNRAAEWVKRVLIRQVDWWFAYSQSSKATIRQAGFPADCITTVQNTIDDCELQQGISAVTQVEIDAERHRLGITGCRIVIYCGGLYAEKRLDFLLKACRRLRDLVPDVEVLIIGSGPDQRRVEEACEHHHWMHFVGPVFGSRRALYFAMSQALLMPGLVGLAIVDSFVSGVPLFTTNLPIHSPEIDYLRHRDNGIITEPIVEDYAGAIAHYLNNHGDLERLRKGCRESAEMYTLENMVQNFVEGVKACLALTR